MINKIEMIGHCFGNSVEVDGIDILDHCLVYQENFYDEEQLEKVKNKKSIVIEELINTLTNMNIDEVEQASWEEIVGFLLDISPNFKVTVDDYDDCGQCGNYNHNKTYIRE